MYETTASVKTLSVKVTFSLTQAVPLPSEQIQIQYIFEDIQWHYISPERTPNSRIVNNKVLQEVFLQGCVDQQHLHVNAMFHGEL